MKKLKIENGNMRFVQREYCKIKIGFHKSIFAT